MVDRCESSRWLRSHLSGASAAHSKDSLRHPLDPTLITFVPDKPGEYAFNCGMGMMTPDSKIIVTPNGKG
jgi:plastocyanin domain-containing protein